MQRARLMVLLGLVSGVADAVPPVPALRTPVDAGWTRRQADLEAFVAPVIPFSVGAFDFEVDLPPGTAVYQARAPVDRGTSNSSVFHTAGAGLPDAGLLFWRARAVDDAGVVSAWSPFETFRIDDQAPALPAPLTVSLDGGEAHASWPAVGDSQSGLKEYHLLIGQLDAPDAAFLPNFDTRYLPQAPAQRVRLGPGRWILGVHAHDQVMNGSGGSTPSAELDVPVSAAVAVPEPPRMVRFDGGALATAPYTRFSPVRLAWGPDAGPATVGYAVIARNGEAWVHVAESDGNAALAELDDGRYDVRVAALEPGAVSAYSGPTQVVVDTANPFTPSPTARLDAGQVSIRWQSVRDRSGPAGSGVLEYRVERCCPTVALPNVPDVPDASIATVDSPGAGDWRWDVRAVDRAGNVGSAGSAYLGPPPPAPAPPVANPPVTRLPVALSWAALDAGAPVTWNLFRLDPAGGSVAVGAGLVGLAAADPAPQGRWRYTLQAIAREQTGPVSAPSNEVLVDLEAPDAGIPTALRVAPRELRVEWAAADALSGVAATAQLFRETNGVEQALGARASPATDLPADGTHRYRVEVSDVAGNVTASGWSAPVATPGTTLTLEPVEGQSASCGREAVLVLTTTGEPATQWSVVAPSTEAIAIDATGRLTFTPTKATPSPLIVTVRAQSATSLAERPITFTVTCAPVALAVGCGCHTAGAPLALAALAALLLIGRSRRVSP